MSSLIALLCLRSNLQAEDQQQIQTQGRSLKMEIKRSGSQPSAKGSADYFTGTVRIDPLFQANDPARSSGAGKFS